MKTPLVFYMNQKLQWVDLIRALQKMIKLLRGYRTTQ